MNHLQLTFPPDPIPPSMWKTLKVKLHRSVMVSEEHPHTMEYFRSAVAILIEKKRQYHHHNYVVHPLSKFNQVYEVWCLFFYGFLLFSKTFDFGFIQISTRHPFEFYSTLIKACILFDIISMFMIILEFFRGFEQPRTRTIQLSKGHIAARYFNSGHFICDLLSSIPRVVTWNSGSVMYLSVLTLVLLKLRRLPTFLILVKPAAHYFRIQSQIATFLIGFFFSVFAAMHVMTCLYVGITRYRPVFNDHYVNNSWANKDFQDAPLVKQYASTFFSRAQFTLLVDTYDSASKYIVEEAVLSIINYVVGKIIMIIIWIVLLNIFMEQRDLKVKFEGIMTELKDYLHSKKIPPKLQKRLLDYYSYKYQNLFFFNESSIKNMLTENLKREVDVFLCKSLIEQVSIFSEMSSRAVQQLIPHLIPEIFLCQDTIIHAGSLGDCMYFIESGTVAVFTPSGKEVCHLQDGAHFGEISLLLKRQKRSATIISVETTRVYKLKKSQFQKYFKVGSDVYQILLLEAESRLMTNVKIEEEYKILLLTQSAQIS